MVGPRKAMHMEPIVVRPSHIRAPRMLRDCTFERLPIQRSAFHRSRRIVFWGCAFAIAALAVILYFTRSL
jgi:hypothetical protein